MNGNDLDPKEELSSVLGTETKQVDKFSIMQRGVALLYGVILPILAFSLVDILKPSWQSYLISDYVYVLLSRSASWPFWPIMLYSMFSLCAVLFKKRWTSPLYIRIGLYIGTLWSFQYMILFYWIQDYVLLPFFFIGIIISMIPIALFYRIKKLSLKVEWIIKSLILLGVIIVNFLLHNIFLILLLYSLILLLTATPLLCFAVYVIFSFYAYRKSIDIKQQSSLMSKIVLWFGGLTGYAGAGCLSIYLVLTEYSKLSTEKPDCYIATATAKGHRHFVRSQDIVLSNGREMQVNDQLRRLKCGELLIKAVAPKIHKLMRKIYDTIGPLLARCLRWPVLADVAYVLLKPAEWLVLGILFVLFGRKRDIVEKFYSH